jgi:hypothetical protein
LPPLAVFVGRNRGLVSIPLPVAQLFFHSLSSFPTRMVSSTRFASSFLVFRSWASAGRVSRSSFLSDHGTTGFLARDQAPRAALAARIDFGCRWFLPPLVILVLVFGQELATRRPFSLKVALPIFFVGFLPSRLIFGLSCW